MQLATMSETQPWVCTVYFVADDGLNLYWLSLPERRHSQELAKNPKAAVTMALKTDLPVIGLAAEGLVDIVTDKATVKKVMRKYVKKYDLGEKFSEKFLKGENQHLMYKFVPSKYILFDELNNPKNVSVDFLL